MRLRQGVRARGGSGRNVRLLSILAPLRRPAALAGGGFLLIAAGIFANALYLQSGRHPSPLFATRTEPELPAAQPAQPDALVQAVQAALRDAGLYGGAVDGIAGPQTSAAILAFEERAGRNPVGAATPDLLDAILAAAAPLSAATPDPARPQDIAAVAADPRVAQVQQALSRAAYGQIVADGVMGPQTEDAIRRFQADHGLPATGEISDALLVELRAAGALGGE